MHRAYQSVTSSADVSRRLGKVPGARSGSVLQVLEVEPGAGVPGRPHVAVTGHTAGALQHLREVVRHSTDSMFAYQAGALDGSAAYSETTSDALWITMSTSAATATARSSDRIPQQCFSIELPVGTDPARHLESSASA